MEVLAYTLNMHSYGKSYYAYNIINGGIGLPKVSVAETAMVREEARQRRRAAHSKSPARRQFRYPEDFGTLQATPPACRHKTTLSRLSFVRAGNSI